MPWLRNPFSRSPKPDTEASDTEAVPGDNTSPLSPPSPGPDSDGLPRPSQDVAAILSHFKTPTKSLSGHQIFYIFVIDGIGAALLSGGINFAIAYAMYTTQNTTLHPIRLFHLPNTLAGDAAVTIIVQSLITWLIEYALVNRDLRSGGVSPIGFLPRPRRAYLKRLFFLDEFAPPGGGSRPDQGGWRLRDWVRFLLENAARAMATAVVGFVLLWPASMGILTAVGRREGGDWVYEKTWTPQVFKLVLGGVWALIQTPVYAGFWLVREGWVLLGEEGGEVEGIVDGDEAESAGGSTLVGVEEEG